MTYPNWDALCVEFRKLKVLVPSYWLARYEALWTAIWDRFFAPRVIEVTT